MKEEKSHILNKIILSCGRGKCCPEIIKTKNNEFIIKDDYDGEVKLNLSQINLLEEAIKKRK
jgi:hypothetical protein